MANEIDFMGGHFLVPHVLIFYPQVLPPLRMAPLPWPCLHTLTDQNLSQIEPRSTSPLFMSGNWSQHKSNTSWKADVVLG